MPGYCLIALFLLTVGLFPSAALQAGVQGPAAQETIMAGEGIGLVKIGGSLMTAREQWGPPDKELGSGSETLHRWDAIQTEVLARKGIIYVIKTSHPPFRTRDGIRPGISMKKLIRLWGEQYVVAPKQAPTEEETLGYPGHKGIFIQVRDGVVTSLLIYRPADPEAQKNKPPAPGEPLVIPPVIGLTIEEARARLAEREFLVPPHVYYENSAEKAGPLDRVVAVSPPEGARVQKGLTVLLIAGKPADSPSREEQGNQGRPQTGPGKASVPSPKDGVSMPTVIGLTVRAAKETLSKQGFTRITVTAPQMGPDEAQMQVWSTQPDPGEPCALDQEVLLFAKPLSAESRSPAPGPAPTPQPPGPGGRPEPGNPPRQEPQRKPEDPTKAIETILRILQIFRRPW